MERITSSDLKTNSTMLATESFDRIVQHVQSSCLNFHLQISPFSAVISIKKSLIKDKSGNVILPPTTLRHGPKENIESLVDKNRKLEKDLIDIKKKYENAIKDCENANHRIQNLEKHRQKETEIKVEETSNADWKLLLTENDNLKNVLENRDHEIFYLQKENKSAKEASEKLNRILLADRDKFEKEKQQLIKEHKAEIKTWKKHLGEANSKIVKLEKKLKESVDTLKEKDQLSKDNIEAKRNNSKLKEELAVKDDELCEVLKEKGALEEKVNSLLDVLYGCPECGLNSCECDDCITEEDYKPEDSSSPQYCTSQPSPPPTSSA